MRPHTDSLSKQYIGAHATLGYPVLRMICRTLQIVGLTLLLATPTQFAHSEISGDQLPDFGDSSGALISPVQEQEFGEAFMRSVRSQVKLVGDPNINSYIHQLGARLVANSDTPNYRAKKCKVSTVSSSSSGWPEKEVRGLKSPASKPMRR